MTFLCTLLFTYIERLILYLTLHTCCRRDKRLYTVVVKNMEGHGQRNMKTSIMFTLATAFLIFAQSSFHIIAEVIMDLGL